MTRATAGLLLMVSACSGTATGVAFDAGIEGEADAPAPESPDAAIQESPNLVGTTWTLPPHTEEYICVRKTVTEDLYIGRFEPIAPLGTHHTVLTIDDSPEVDGVTPCSSFTAAPHMIYGSGVGTLPYDLPEGVAMKVSAGQQLLLNLHLYNTADEPLVGTSGVRMITIPRERVVHEAEVVLAGTVALVIPPGTSKHTGRCTMPGDVTLFGVGAHMHRLGIHQKVTIERTAEVMRDSPYSFDDQNLAPVEASLRRGDRVLVECSYANDTGKYVFWGESSDAEMCFASLMRYPAQGRHHVCLE